MNIYLEVLLRTVGVFLSVFFTVGWGRKSKPSFDVFFIILAVVLAIFLAFREPEQLISPSFAPSVYTV